ncbi:hypothetical protein QOZ80_3BG0261290 [Eleusine coracana subsp. coracana]|nr:hypothetical protein QOZ80_3BG0261290 [Eleusine coracana subsp. coracana]
MEQDLALLLPDDLLADVLRRVAPRDLAVSRCVCRAWRALIDEHGLLRTDLLPLSLAGLFLRFAFVEYHEIEYAEPELFARPPVDIAYSMPTDLYDHCNGLILEYESVFNPATGGRAPLPDPPVSSRLELDDWRYFYFHQHLAFDPTVSPHYEVFMVPYVRYYFRLDVLPTDNVLLLQSEWPPSLWVLRVLSSRTGRWQERSFVREGEAAGTVAGLRSSCASDHAVYCRDALYIHCQKDFVVVIVRP